MGRRLAETLARAGAKALLASCVGVAALQGESGQDADSSGGGEHLDVVSIHLVLERCRSHLVQAFKLQGHPAAIGKDEAVKPDSQAGLIAVGYGLGRTDGAGSPGDQDALAVGWSRRARIPVPGPDRGKSPESWVISAASRNDPS